MSDSLRDQLLKAGLVTEKQVKQAERPPPRKDKARKGTPPPLSEAAQQAAAARAAKLARDQALNRERELNAAARARQAEIKQLIEQGRVTRPESDDYYNFVDRGKVRRLAVDAELRARIIDGSIRIARSEGKYYLVTGEVAGRIAERDPRAVITPGAESPAAADPDDPYKDYVVPDDLTW